MALLSEQAVGSIIKIKVNGSPMDFIVIQHGKPSDGYDNSCDGTWVQTKDALESGVAFNTSSTNDYAISSINQSLNTFVDTLDPEILTHIHTVKLNYDNAPSIGVKTVTAKAFLLSCYECGMRGLYGYIPEDGTTVLQYYTPEGTGSAESRKTLFSGAPVGWWTRTRSNYNYSTTDVIYVQSNTWSANTTYATNPMARARRPAIVLDNDLIVDDQGNIIFNQPPTTPTNLQVSSPILSDKPVTLSWTASTDPEGALAGYIAQRKLDTGEFTEFYRGSNAKCTDSGVAFGTQKVTYRVCAYDTENLQSGFVTSEEFTVVNNHDPVIDGEDKDLGELSAAPAITYTATDEDSGDTLTSTITLDDVQLTTGTITSGEQQTYQVTAEQWLEVLNGSHTIKITVTDQNGGQAVRTLTFSKKTIKIVVENTEPVKTDAAARRIVLTLGGLFSAGSSVKVEVCNNGFDEVKSWEDATSKLTTGGKYIFINDTKTAAEWGVCWRLTIERGSADGEVWISSGSGACDD